MSVSGSTSFAMNAGQMIDKAFHRLGKASEGEAVTARMYEDALSSLNLIIKSSIGASDRLWLRTEGTQALTANIAAYTINAPNRVFSVRRVSSSGYEVPLDELSRQEYYDLPNKTASPSVPVGFFFDPQVSTGTLFVWPAPDSTAAAQYTLNYTYLRRPDDMISANDSLDMPQEWLDPMIWMLADDLETEYPVNDARLAQKISMKAAMAKQTLDYWDTENTSVFMQPDLG